MRTLLALLFLCLVGCMGIPPTTGGVLHYHGCPAYWQPSDFPLPLVVDRRLSPERQDALQQAVLEWNEATGAQVFTVVREIDWYDSELLHPRDGTVYVLQSDLVDNDFPNVTQGLAVLHNPNCYIENVLVFIDVAVPNEDARLVWKHELGHSLGLAHDHWQPSIMWRFATASGDRIMENDLNYIRWEMTRDYQADSPVSERPTFDGGTAY